MYVCSVYTYREKLNRILAFHLKALSTMSHSLVGTLDPLGLNCLPCQSSSKWFFRCHSPHPSHTLCSSLWITCKPAGLLSTWRSFSGYTHITSASGYQRIEERRYLNSLCYANRHSPTLPWPVMMFTWDECLMRFSNVSVLYLTSHASALTSSKHLTSNQNPQRR